MKYEVNLFIVVAHNVIKRIFGSGVNKVCYTWGRVANINPPEARNHSFDELCFRLFNFK